MLLVFMLFFGLSGGKRLDPRCTYEATLQEENFYWYLNFAFSLMANSLNLNSAYYYTFRNLSMIAYMIEI